MMGTGKPKRMLYTFRRMVFLISFHEYGLPKNSLKCANPTQSLPEMPLYTL